MTFEMQTPAGGTPPAPVTTTQEPPNADAVASESAQPSTTRQPPVARPAMPDEALRARLERARKQERENLLKTLGVDSPDKVKADLEELKRLREESEKIKRQTMSREEQLQADLEKERARIAELETKLHEETTSRVYEKQDAMINGLASKYIDPTPIKLKSARREFAEYIDTLPKSQVARLRDKDIEKWFAKFAKDYPDFAKKEAAPESTQAETVQAEAAKPAPKSPPAPIRKPASTAAPAKKSPPEPASQGSDPSVNPQGKTFRPGQPNSMSRAEMNAELKKRGLRGWR